MNSRRGPAVFLAQFVRPAAPYDTPHGPAGAADTATNRRILGLE